MSVMVKCCVLFEVRTAFLNTIKTSVGFKALNKQGVRVRSGFIWLRNGPGSYEYG
jgi:hypothetical protein